MACTLHQSLAAAKGPVRSHATFNREIDTTGYQSANFRFADSPEIVCEFAAGHVYGIHIIRILNDSPFNGKSLISP